MLHMPDVDKAAMPDAVPPRIGAQCNTAGVLAMSAAPPVFYSLGRDGEARTTPRIRQREEICLANTQGQDRGLPFFAGVGTQNLVVLLMTPRYDAKRRDYDRGDGEPVMYIPRARDIPLLLPHLLGM